MTDPAREAAERIAPCCKTRWRLPDIGPIFFNQYNDTVQCHNCGATFDQRALSTAGDREALAKLLCCLDEEAPPGYAEGIFAQTEHFSDCIKVATTCCVCLAETFRKRADAILASGFRRDGVREA